MIPKSDQLGIPAEKLWQREKYHEVGSGKPEQGVREVESQFCLKVSNGKAQESVFKLGLSGTFVGNNTKARCPDAK